VVILVVAIAINVLSGATVALWGLSALFVILAMVSFVDDARGLPAGLRLAIQALVAVGSLAMVGSTVSNGWSLMWLGFAAVAWLWITGYTNAFNFMDGINGIAASQAIVTSLGTAVIAHALGIPEQHPTVLLAIVIGGAAIGFLPYNFPRATVFMGDVGSAPLGFLLAFLAVWVAAITHPWVLVWIALLHANFVLDTAITLFRRARRGDRLHEAHREHFYQRLVRAGYTHTRVTLTECALQVFVALALWFATPATWTVRVAVGVSVIMLWLAFFAFAEAKFRVSLRSADLLEKVAR
jgi:UDP-N-acetylmuramyl pentapeptide phosphotransferase/UDP-N-acetylglucosamine-1-phosphate transferase